MNDTAVEKKYLEVDEEVREDVDQDCDELKDGDHQPQHASGFISQVPSAPVATHLHPTYQTYRSIWCINEAFIVA